MSEFLLSGEIIVSSLALATALSADSFFAAFALNPHTQLGRPHPLLAHRNAFIFGFIQSVLFFIGYQMGRSPAASVLELADIQTLDHWIAFGILSLISIKFFIESKKADDCANPIATQKSLGLVCWIAIATSLDALGVGVGIGLVAESTKTVTFQTALVGLVTYSFVFLAQRIAGRLPQYLKPKLQIASSILLMGLGVKILHDHGVFVLG